MTLLEDGAFPPYRIELSPQVLSQGFRTIYEGRPARVQGMNSDPNVVDNYIHTLSSYTRRGTRAVAPVYDIVVPVTEIDPDKPVTSDTIRLIPRAEAKLPFATLLLLNEAAHYRIFRVRWLGRLHDYYNCASHIHANPSSFLNTLSQTSHLMVISDFVGDTVRDFLVRYSNDDSRSRVGSYLGDSLCALHEDGLVVGNTHLNQFAVRLNDTPSFYRRVGAKFGAGNIENVERVHDLGSIRTGDQATEEVKNNEILALLHELSGISAAAAVAFNRAYYKH